ncbi:MAG: VWA domain-containing protein [Candidatus Solibacter sp.]
MAAALWWPLLAQVDQDSLISIQVSRVVLHATVREGKGRFVGDLQKQNFEVLEDGVRQEIVSFSREDLPVAAGILVDNSQSMFNKNSEVVAAAKAFVRASNPKDEIFVLHFNDHLTYGLPPNIPFTSERSLLFEALDRLSVDGQTALYDAIIEGLNQLKKSKLAKKALFVISDGGDNLSRHKDTDVIRDADLSGSLFYAIGIYDPMDGDANPGVLRKLALNTGGEVFFPKELAEVSKLCENIARDLRSQYMISYAPPEKAAGGRDYRKIQVRVKDPQRRKLVVRTRTGYYASSTEGQKP